MTLLAPSAPLVTIRHDWTDPVEIEPTWPSRVLTKEDGTEQRLPLSQAATEVVTYRLLAPTYGDAANLKTLLDNATDALVRVPRWEDEARVTTAVSAGASTIPCDPSDRPSFVAGSEVLLWRSATSYEVAVIATVGGSSIDTVDPLVSAWGAGTIVVPINEARVQLPIALTHWVPTSGALAVAFAFDVRDLAGIGTGGGAVTGTVASLSIAWRNESTAPSLLRSARIIVAAEAFDAAGDPLSNVPVVWSSSSVSDGVVRATLDPMVAVVEGTRTAFAFADITITGTVGSVSDSLDIRTWSW